MSASGGWSMLFGITFCVLGVFACGGDGVESISSTTVVRNAPSITPPDGSSFVTPETPAVCEDASMRSLSDCVTASVSVTHPWYPRFEGVMYDNACDCDADCFVRGCNKEVCSATSSMGTTCEVFDDLPSGSCGCVDGECIWYNDTCG